MIETIKAALAALELAQDKEACVQFEPQITALRAAIESYVFVPVEPVALGSNDEPHGPPEFGCCLPPGECCMPGLHFPSDWRRADEMRADWEAELRRDAFGA